MNESGGENLLHFHVDLLFRQILQRLLSSSDLAIDVRRNVSDSSHTSEQNKRPDFLFYVNDFLILRGEEKSKRMQLRDAETELVNKLKVWSAHTFGRLQYIFGLACAGQSLTICALSSLGQVSRISQTFNFERVQDRLQVLICVINLARLIKTCLPRMPRGITKLYEKIRRPNGSIVIYEDCVVKKVLVSSLQSQERYTYLTNLYRNMLEAKVPHVIECMEISPPSQDDDIYIRLKLKPCGIVFVPTSFNELLTALKCILLALEAIHRLGYVHRDVRWLNIIYVNSNDWRLIDFENSTRGDPTLQNEDMRSVGKLLSNCSTLIASSEPLLSLRDQLISESPTPIDASTALELLAQVSI